MKRSLLLLQGGPGLGKEYLNDGFAFLSASHDIKSFEYIGCGNDMRASVPTLQLTLETLLHSIRSELPRPGSFDVITHSWGSYLLLELLRMDPRLTSGNLIFVTPCPASSQGFQSIGKNIQSFVSERISPQEQLRLNQLIPDSNGPNDKEYIRILKPCYVHNAENMHKLRFENYNRSTDDRISKAMGSYDQSQILAKVTNQTHLILGEFDFIRKADVSEHLTYSKSSTTLTEVGHSPFVEDPAAFARTITQLLNT